MDASAATASERPRRHRLRRWVVRIAFAVVVLGLLYVVGTFVQVWATSHRDDDGSADAVVVLGAAQYDGRPSPVLQARLDHALELYESGHADAVILTGGKQAGDRFTEAFSGYDYLKGQGVPEEDLFLEVEGTNTYEQLSATHLIMDNNDFESVTLVSDPYHSQRLLAIADEVGIQDVSVSPTDTGSTLSSLARETVAVSLGRIVGFRRLDNWL
jgi:vancomycin permeability regulator SanA